MLEVLVIVDGAEDVRGVAVNVIEAGTYTLFPVSNFSCVMGINSTW